MKLFYVKLFLVLALIGIPDRANAGILSFMDGVFSSADAKVTEVGSIPNSQNMALLQAAVNTDPNPTLDDTDITIVDGTALFAESGPVSTTTSSKVTKTNDSISTYVVREGDTIIGIAKMFGVSVNTIMWANDLTRNSTLKLGQTLVILPITGVKYTVKTGDTVGGLAKRFGGDAAEIISFNNLPEGGKLTVGEEIIIPDGDLVVPASTSKTGTGSNGSTLASYSGYFARPVDKYTRTQGIHGHNGVDLAASYGTPIHAAAAGTVIISKSSGWNGGYGIYVVIAHSNGTQTLYSHLSQTNVVQGQKVSKGQTIGLMGNSGKVQGVTGVHLHFEVRGAKNPF